MNIARINYIFLEISNVLQLTLKKMHDHQEHCTTPAMNTVLRSHQEGSFANPHFREQWRAWSTYVGPSFYRLESEIMQLLDGPYKALNRFRDPIGFAFFCILYTGIKCSSIIERVWSSSTACGRTFFISTTRSKRTLLARRRTFRIACFRRRRLILESRKIVLDEMVKAYGAKEVPYCGVIMDRDKIPPIDWNPALWEWWIPRPSIAYHVAATPALPDPYYTCKWLLP